MGRKRIHLVTMVILYKVRFIDITVLPEGRRANLISYSFLGSTFQMVDLSLAGYLTFVVLVRR